MDETARQIVAKIVQAWIKLPLWAAWFRRIRLWVRRSGCKKRYSERQKDRAFFYGEFDAGSLGRFLQGGAQHHDRIRADIQPAH